MLRSLAFLAAFALLSLSRAAVIVTGADWKDTSGNIIQAHGGGILKVLNVVVSGLSLLLKNMVCRRHRLAPPSTGLVKTRPITVVSSELFRATL